MYSRTKHIKFILALFFMSIISFFIYPQDSSEDNTDFYAIVTYIKAFNNIKPSVYYPEGQASQLELNDKIIPGATLLTTDGQGIEIIIYKGNIAYGIILIKENTDFKFQFNNLKTILDIRVIYGGIRGVIKEGVLASINSETIKSAIYDADFGLISVINEEGIRKGYSIVFGGELEMASRQNLDNSEIVKALQICEFQNYLVYTPRSFNENEFLAWKKDMLFKTEKIPNNLNLILENLEFNKIFKKEKKSTLPKFDPKKFASSLLSFEAGTLNYDKNIALKMVWRPGTTAMGDKFEFGFYLPLYLIPSKAFTKDAILRINRNNNEWSFGTDQNGNAKAIVFDIFDDILLKTRIIRFNTIADTGFIQIGNYFNISDFREFSMVDFNSKIFYPKFRKTSFIAKVNLDWFDLLLYAEDIMPKGLYGIDLSFMTPAQSFKFRYRISTFMDCFDLINFTDIESFFPAQFNNTINFDAFNVPSLGFSVFISGGLYLPFSYNFTTNSSMFIDLINKNPYAIASGTSGSTGFSLRISDFTITSEFIFDSGINKIGLFDTMYLATREYRSLLTSLWMSILTSRAVSISDFNFGGRIKIKYNFFRHFLIETSYQITLAYNTLTPIIYDKLYFKVQAGTANKLTVNFDFYTQWNIQSLPQALTDPRNFQLNNLIYFGFVLRPNAGIELNLAAGMYPNFLTYNDPWYSQLMLDFSISIKPLPMFDLINKEKAKINL